MNKMPIEKSKGPWKKGKIVKPVKVGEKFPTVSTGYESGKIDYSKPKPEDKKSNKNTNYVMYKLEELDIYNYRDLIKIGVPIDVNYKGGLRNYVESNRGSVVKKIKKFS